MAVALNSDFRDLFAELNAVQARFLVIGGYAVSFHGRPRYTKDLDIWVEAEPENARRVHEALKRFGAPTANLHARDLATPDLVFIMGVAPSRIDILTSLKGVSFEEAWAARVVESYGDQAVNVIGVGHLIANKRLVGRPQDLADVAALEGLPGSR